MGEHADDTMNHDLEPGDYYDGDGGPSDQEIDRFIHGTLRATPSEVAAGMRFQDDVMRFLNGGRGVWVPSRSVILGEQFGPGTPENVLSRHDFSLLNYLESVRGDLLDIDSDPVVAVECQTAVTAIDSSWEHSKRERCRAAWQCFGFKSGARLMVRTDAIRDYLDRWDVLPNESRRGGGGPYYSLSEVFLMKIGAVGIAEWRDSYGNR